MKRFLYELSESWKIAAAQMGSNLTRSTLTALGVIIGIIAVTLMGTAVNGISVGFDKSMAVLGDDVLYVTQWPWKPVDDWWNYRDRKKIKTEYAETLKRMIAATPNSNLIVAVPTSNLMRSVKYGGNQVDNVFVLGTTSDSLLAEKYLLNAPSGTATIESQLNKPRNVPCRVFTPMTLNNWPLINTDLSIGLWEGKRASATS